LNVHGRTGKGRFEAEAGKTGGQSLVVKVGRFFIPMESGNDCAVRERQSPVAKGIDRKIVAQLRANVSYGSGTDAGTDTFKPELNPSGTEWPYHRVGARLHFHGVSKKVNGRSSAIGPDAVDEHYAWFGLLGHFLLLAVTTPTGTRQLGGDPCMLR
jgi:hypothetical protein